MASLSADTEVQLRMMLDVYCKLQEKDPNHELLKLGALEHDKRGITFSREFWDRVGPCPQGHVFWAYSQYKELLADALTGHYKKPAQFNGGHLTDFVNEVRGEPFFVIPSKLRLILGYYGKDIVSVQKGRIHQEIPQVDVGAGHILDLVAKLNSQGRLELVEIDPLRIKSQSVLKKNLQSDCICTVIIEDGRIFHDELLLRNPDGSDNLENFVSRIINMGNFEEVYKKIQRMQRRKGYALLPEY